ncbi:MAG: phosphatase PAP2 family protein [bacterium]
MNTIKIHITLFIFIFSINTLYPQDRDFPYELKNQDLLLLPLGTGLSLWNEYLSGQVDHPNVYMIRTLNRNNINKFDRSATYYWSPGWSDQSDLYRNILIFSAFLSSIPPVFRGKFTQSITLGTMMAESFFFLRTITHLTKIVTHRERPYLYNTKLSAEKRYEFYSSHSSFAFYSGHTAAAFLATTFLSKVSTDIYGNTTGGKFLWVSSLTVAALTGYARIKAGMHYPTDVITGAVVGVAVGYLVTSLHKKNTDDRISMNISQNHISLCFYF